MSPAEPFARQLLQAAIQARTRSYAPYSHFAVGAAIGLPDKQIFVGTNVENCSYGLTMCAERTAVVGAVTANVLPHQKIAWIVVVSDAPHMVAPCGACRQVLHEFSEARATVLLHNLRDGGQHQTTMDSLLPMAFVPRSLSSH